jgi:hypothetical protein
MTNITGNSADAKVSAVRGTNTSTPIPGIEGASVGVEGESQSGWGVYGHSKTGRGVVAESDADYGLRASSTRSAGIRGSSVEGRGVEGWAMKSEGVVGISASGTGVWGQTDGAGTGVLGTSVNGAGVHGISTENDGVLGEGSVGVYGRNSVGVGNGVIGYSDAGRGVWGHSNNTGIGVLGESAKNEGVRGASAENSGVFGIGRTGGFFEGSFEGVHAVSHDPVAAGVAGYNDKTGPGIFGKSTGGGAAGIFDGNVVVTRDLTVDGEIWMNAADCAEDFDIAEADTIEPGTVMVLGERGLLYPSQTAYDPRAIGVVSGAGNYRPGIVLDKQQNSGMRKPIALLGKVFCKVDATSGPIRIGDLLTTSDRPGHAMRAADTAKAFGASIGKALRPLKEGQGLIPILVTLQ